MKAFRILALGVALSVLAAFFPTVGVMVAVFTSVYAMSKMR